MREETQNPRALAGLKAISSFEDPGKVQRLRGKKILERKTRKKERGRGKERRNERARANLLGSVRGQ